MLTHAEETGFTSRGQCVPFEQKIPDASSGASSAKAAGSGSAGTPGGAPVEALDDKDQDQDQEGLYQFEDQGDQDQGDEGKDEYEDEGEYQDDIDFDAELGEAPPYYSENGQQQEHVNQGSLDQGPVAQEPVALEVTQELGQENGE